MKVLYIGSGFVGACSAAVMADSGHHVLVYDVDETKIQKLSSCDVKTIESCIFEDGLADLLIINKDRIAFTTDYDRVKQWLDETDLVFMCLPTPEKPGAEGESDLTFYYTAAEKLAQHLAARNNGSQNKYIVIVNKSTVPVSMVSETTKIMERYGVKNFGVVSNPEFLVEGKAIQGSVHPDRVVIGAEKEEDFTIMREAYSRFYNSTAVTYIEANPYEAEAGKLLANYLLFDRLAATFDVVGRLCEVFPNIRYESVRHILTSEPRIGTWGFYNSVYAGGSCFIKDAASLAHQLEEAGARADKVRQTLDANRFQRDRFFSRAQKEAGFTWEGKTVALLGVAFKQDTNDVRNSPALDIARHLLESNVKELRIHDPTAMTMFKHAFECAHPEKVVYCASEEEALSATAACFILTDWPRFRALTEKILQQCRPPYLIMDGRRMIQEKYGDLQTRGYDIVAVGSPFMKGRNGIADISQLQAAATRTESTS